MPNGHFLFYFDDFFVGLDLLNDGSRFIEAKNVVLLNFFLLLLPLLPCLMGSANLTDLSDS